MEFRAAAASTGNRYACRVTGLISCPSAPHTAGRRTGKGNSVLLGISEPKTAEAGPTAWPNIACAAMRPRYTIPSPDSEGTDWHRENRPSGGFGADPNPMFPLSPCHGRRDEWLRAKAQAVSTSQHDAQCFFTSCAIEVCHSVNANQSSTSSPAVPGEDGVGARVRHRTCRLWLLHFPGTPCCFTVAPAYARVKVLSETINTS
ncbi:hypothetical protein LZ30DRAFT_10467 [Colletotrichum cereale]|nr:hypothetical protein LZ30DRAFT_10467 [Colletotrichum cereale]